MRAARTIQTHWTDAKLYTGTQGLYRSEDALYLQTTAAVIPIKLENYVGSVQTYGVVRLTFQRPSISDSTGLEKVYINSDFSHILVYLSPHGRAEGRAPPLMRLVRTIQ